jgi:hypothetical protein
VPGEVIFHYVYQPTPSPVPATPTPLPFDTAMDGYGYPVGTNVNFRSSPTTEANNVIGSVRSSDLAHILGQTSNSKNEIWYAVEINGQTGYLKDSVLRILTDAEVAALFNYTPAPGQSTRTPAPTEIPTNNMINRFRMGPALPTAASALSPTKRPTMMLSTVLYSCCAMFPISIGIMKFTIRAAGLPVVISTAANFPFFFSIFISP